MDRPVAWTIPRRSPPDDRDILRMIGRERDALHSAQCQQRAAETRHHDAKIAEILKLILAER
jgi:hypothetical protein